VFDTSTIHNHIIKKGRIFCLQVNILHGLMKATQHNYGFADHYVAYPL